MRLIDADKLYPNRMTNKGNVAISQSQIAKAPTVNAVSEEVYTREYNLRKDAEMKAYKLEKVIDKIRAEILNDWQIKKYPSSPFSCGLKYAVEIIDKYRGEEDETDN